MHEPCEDPLTHQIVMTTFSNLAKKTVLNPPFPILFHMVNFPSWNNPFLCKPVKF